MMGLIGLNKHPAEILTPPWLRFEVLTRKPLPRGEGALFDYRLRVRGLSIRWRTLIERFEPPASFVDVQTEGPYRLWRHTHSFADVPGGTAIADQIEYELPLGPLGILARAVFVRRQLDEIFGYRRRVIDEIFGARR